MSTLRHLASLSSLPLSTTWALSDLGELRGMQELFTRSAPQVLKTLKDFALVESAVSSNRIEGVHVDGKRIGTVVFGQSPVRDRDEEEIRGYKQALDRIYSNPESLPITLESIQALHRLTRGEIWDAGLWKDRDGDIIEKYPDGRERVRFQTVPASQTPQAMADLVDLYRDLIRDRVVPPLVVIAAFNLDFLCIHPFRDGNGRVSRLLLALQLVQSGYEVGRYLSLERLIESNKERYYETLETSSLHWHEAKHDPWPYTNYLLFIVKTAYKDFEERARRIKPAAGAKSQAVVEAIRTFPGQFTITELQTACSEASPDLLRKVLKQLKAQGAVEPVGFGRLAAWRAVLESQYWELK
ncbi:MAG: Fic family protein [Spirochaetales bacterium]